MNFQNKVEWNQNSTQGLIVIKTSAALKHGPFEVVLELFLALLVADEYWSLSSMSVAPTGLSDAAWLITELKTNSDMP